MTACFFFSNVFKNPQVQRNGKLFFLTFNPTYFKRFDQEGTHKEHKAVTLAVLSHVQKLFLH